MADEKKKTRKVLIGSATGTVYPTMKNSKGITYIDVGRMAERRGRHDYSKGAVNFGRPVVTFGGDENGDGGRVFNNKLAQSMSEAEQRGKYAEQRRKAREVLESTGLYGDRVLSVIHDPGDPNWNSDDFGPGNRTDWYEHGFKKLKSRVGALQKQADVFRDQLAAAKSAYGQNRPRGFDDFVQKNKAKFDYKPEYDKYMTGVNQRIQLALYRNNPSEAARLAQVAEGRRVQMQEMAQKKAQSAWAGSADQRLWQAQQNLENTLANRQAQAMEGISSALKTNAQIASALGVDAQLLYDQPKAPQPTQQGSVRGQTRPDVSKPKNPEEEKTRPGQGAS